MYLNPALAIVSLPSAPLSLLRVVRTDDQAERPDATSGRLRFVKTTQLVMRKDLRFPPPDTLLLPAALLAALSLYLPNAAPLLSLLAAGDLSGAAEVVSSLLAPLLAALAEGDVREAWRLAASPVLPL